MSKRTEMRAAEAEWRRASPQAPKRTRTTRKPKRTMRTIWEAVCRSYKI